MSFSDLPAGAQVDKIKPYKIDIPQDDLEQMLTLIKYARIAPKTWENSNNGSQYGIERDWLIQAREYWLNKFDWRQVQSKLNSFAQYKAHLQDNGHEYEIHFMASFSKKLEALPILAVHGWPGSFMEFAPMMSLLQEKYTPETLPFSLIAVSMPGYTFSSSPPPDVEARTDIASRLFGQLMTTLGYSEYVVQGGDIGAGIARNMGTLFDDCKGVHVNMLFPAPRDGQPHSTLTATETQWLASFQTFMATGSGYISMHATRTSTIGLALQSSPMALLAWIGEKFRAWTDPRTQPDTQTILESVSLYWLTDTIARCIYPYRQFFDPKTPRTPPPVVPKPLGFSSFEYEIGKMPKSWAELEGDLVFYRHHDQGGHFAAMERPEVLLQDLVEFVGIVEGKVTGGGK